MSKYSVYVPLQIFNGCMVRVSVGAGENLWVEKIE
jgi:hypothetical protein